MQQYMLHRLQEKHRLIIQLLLLIVLILSHQNATQVLFAFVQSRRENYSSLCIASRLPTALEHTLRCFWCFWSL